MRMWVKETVRTQKVRDWVDLNAGSSGRGEPNDTAASFA